MPQCEPYVNPDWSTPTVAKKNALEAIGIAYPAAYWDAEDAFYKSSKATPIEYIVVAGTPSADLDENGRKEIEPGTTITDTRLFGFTAHYLILGAGRNTVNTQYITQTSDTEAATSTIEITSGDSWSDGDIISVVYS